MNNISLLFQKMTAAGNVSTEKIIKSLITLDYQSKERDKKIDGVNYYDSENTEINRQIDKKYKLFKEHKISNGFYKELIDQKISYCCGSEIVIENLPEDYQDIIPDINEFISDLAIGASIKGIEWIYLYKDLQDNLKWRVIDSIECIPIYDTEFQDELIEMIRYYRIEVIENDTIFYRNKVEIWDKEKVTYYMEDQEGNYIFDVELQTNPVFYNQNTVVQLGKIKSIEYIGWGKVPFIQLSNTSKNVYDLQQVKQHIDLYDKMKSGFANNIEQIQEIIFAIKHRGQQNYEEFLFNLEKYRVVEVDEDGEVKALEIQIPYEARKEFLDIVRDDIYRFGQGVDPDKIGDGNITNVVIKARYVRLDLKGSNFIKQINIFLNEFYNFVNIYLSMKGKQLIDVKKLKYTYNKKMIFNESEQVENCVKSDGVTSTKTMLANHPWVNNVDEEIEELDKDKMQYQEDNQQNFENDIDNNLENKKII